MPDWRRQPSRPPRPKSRKPNSSAILASAEVPRMLRLFAILVLVLVCRTAEAAEETRVALVIGNAAYKLGPLKNPINDARAMAATLKALGFEVIEAENAGRKRMQQTLRNFANKLTPNAIGLFYYSAHAIPSKDLNYLV